MIPVSIAEANAIYDRAVARAKRSVGNEDRAVIAEMIRMVLRGDRDLDEALLMTARTAPLHLVTGRRV